MLKNTFFKIENNNSDIKSKILVFFLSAVLITLPLNFAYGSLSCLLFFLYAFLFLRPLKFKPNKALIWPIALYILMICSLLWTQDIQATQSGLQKEAPLLIMPIIFLFIPNLSREIIFKIFRIFSFCMVFYGFYFITYAFKRYYDFGDSRVFFYHELVSKDLSAIYVSTFASFALFYFIQIQKKTIFDKISLCFLAIFIFLLSSRTLITIDFILFVCYYLFFLKTHSGIKGITVFSVSVFLFFSFVFVKQTRERFLIEYQTAFVDNTVNTGNDSSKGKLYNVSLKQAWNNELFNENNYFSGTALRIYQIRIFKEMLQENPVFFTGFGLEASQSEIKEKATQHNLSPTYGAFNFHNQYVQTFADLGFFGLCILVVTVFLNINQAWQNKSFIHFAFSIIILVLFMSESFFCRQRGVIFFITLYCLFHSFDHKQSHKTDWLSKIKKQLAKH